jgi:hypothetical protein
MINRKCVSFQSKRLEPTGASKADQLLRTLRVTNLALFSLSPYFLII